MFPEDAGKRLRRAEIFDLATGRQAGFQRAIELYQEALRPVSQGLAPEEQLEARRRLAELFVQIESFPAAEAEVETLRGLEFEVLAQKPDEWRWPGLTAMELGRKFLKNDPANQRRTVAGESGRDGTKLSDPEKRALAQKAVEERWPGLKAWPGLETLAVAGTLSLTNDEALALAGTLSLTNNSARPRAPLDEAFRNVLEPNPKNNEPKVYVDPEVYVVRHDYRLSSYPTRRRRTWIPR